MPGIMQGAWNIRQIEFSTCPVGINCLLEKPMLRRGKGRFLEGREVIRGRPGFQRESTLTRVEGKLTRGEGMLTREDELLA
jgi:hypothetical protein